MQCIPVTISPPCQNGIYQKWSPSSAPGVTLSVSQLSLSKSACGLLVPWIRYCFYLWQLHSPYITYSINETSRASVATQIDRESLHSRDQFGKILPSIRIRTSSQSLNKTKVFPHCSLSSWICAHTCLASSIRCDILICRLRGGNHGLRSRFLYYIRLVK